MDAVGLYQKYPVNRPLSPKETKDHLPQNVQSSEMPWHALGLIKMNSTFLEMVDKFYPEKGHGALSLAIALSMVLPFVPDLVEIWLKTPDKLGATVFVLVLSLIPAIGYWVFHRETRMTHCPIRFNRKTRKVYVFRRDGTVMTEDWDKLYFTLGLHGLVEKEVRVHRMSEERQTWQRLFSFCKDSHVVLETFALPWCLSGGSPWLLSQWEFVRRYMECPEELDDLAGQVNVVMPVADRRESLMHGFMRHVALTGRVGLLLPYYIVLTAGRWIVMHVARQPKWPPEVEAECQIDPDDPWQLDAPPRGEKVPVWNYATNAEHDGKQPDYIS